jgi:[ribosomal protein S5]-alanine N-acetyltransferase
MGLMVINPTFGARLETELCAGVLADLLRRTFCYSASARGAARRHAPPRTRSVVATPNRFCAMRALKLLTDRLELKPLPRQAAAALPEDREAACRALGSPLSAEWPDTNLFGVLRRHAEKSVDAECFGVWVIIERCSRNVVGDIGFRGPPDDAGTIEVGYSVIPSRRGRGYAAEAASALVEWAQSQPGVHVIVAGCDPDNLPSIYTLERVGFRRTSEARGEIRWRWEQR